MLEIKTPQKGKARRELHKRAPKLVSSKFLNLLVQDVFVSRESYSGKRKTNPEIQKVQIICFFSFFREAEA